MEKYLLILFKCGEEKRDVFVSECSSTSEQFIELICKITITNFASGNFERKNKSKVAELQATKGTRDLFGRLLYLSATNGMDLESVFSLRIPPEPACFAYSDGTSRQNDKLTVFHHLTKDFQSNPSDTIETVIANRMFILNLSTQNFPKTYSALARKILVKVLNLKKSLQVYVLTSVKVPVLKMLYGKIVKTLRLSVNLYRTTSEDSQ